MPATWLVGVLVLGSVLALFRVLPFLAKRGGDFANLHRGAAALVAGESAFARPELDYPPLVPVILAPLGLLPLAEARMVWLGLSLAALVAALVVIWRVAGGDGAASCAIAAVLALDGSALPNLALGQLHPLLLLLLALALLLHSARPRLAAAAVGLAAALKIWPGLLLLSWLPRLPWLPWRGSPGGNDALRTWLSGALTWALLFILPWTVLVVATPPPHLPLAHGYWLGTPALLNFSAPAAALRASYGWEPGAALPDDWVAGVSASWSLTRERQCISVFASLLVLATGLALLLLRVRRERRKAPAHTAAGTGGADVALRPGRARARRGADLLVPLPAPATAGFRPGARRSAARPPLARGARHRRGRPHADPPRAGGVGGPALRARPDDGALLRRLRDAAARRRLVRIPGVGDRTRRRRRQR